MRSANTGRLDIGIDAANGIETISTEFPEKSLPHLEEAANVLRQFAPKENDRRLRRVPQDIVSALPGEEREEEDSLPTALVDRLGSALSEGEEVLARALIPASEEKNSGPKLVAVTADRVLVAGERAASSSFSSYRISDISSVELRSFLLGCHFELSVPAQGRVERVRLDFEYPSVPQFVRVVRVIRQLLASPAVGTSPAGSWKERLIRNIGLKKAV
jgi:hypothetical protein